MPATLINAVIIGDEILSGKRQDRHFAFIVDLLARYRLRLASASFLGDDRAQLTAFFARSLAANDIVLCCGGIGNTPDDHTRQAVAAALNRPLVVSDEVRAVLEQRFKAHPGATLSPERWQLGMFPQGAAMIPNPINQIPGFSLARHHFVPGFPAMAAPMLTWVVERYYAALGGPATLEQAYHLTGELAYESALLPLMQRVVERYPELRLFSLPSLMVDGRRHLELGVEGDPEVVPLAMAEIRQGVEALGITWQLATDSGQTTGSTAT